MYFVSRRVCPPAGNLDRVRFALVYSAAAVWSHCYLMYINRMYTTAAAVAVSYNAHDPVTYCCHTRIRKNSDFACFIFFIFQQLFSAD